MDSGVLHLPLRLLAGAPDHATAPFVGKRRDGHSRTSLPVGDVNCKQCLFENGEIWQLVHVSKGANQGAGVLKSAVPGEDSVFSGWIGGALRTVMDLKCRWQVGGVCTYNKMGAHHA
jgi:hypothetical protein